MEYFLQQSPNLGECISVIAGDEIVFSLKVSPSAAGTAWLRTNLGRAEITREEIIANTETGQPLLAADWHDIAMHPGANPGEFVLHLPAAEPGFYSAKCFFVKSGERNALWPSGANTSIKVVSAHYAHANSVYCAYVRQYGSFRGLIKRLDHIIDVMGFRIIQLLPIHPVPTSFGKMGELGSAFAALDFKAVDPALADWDTAATPLEQFRELVDAVHAHGARILLDIPANHTGWGSVLQSKHPEWFKHNADGTFHSPGAWGVTWADLVELDYESRNPALRAEMAETFIFWCRLGVDGFRCDAGYMIPTETWRYISARVRRAFPDTLFLLEGLGGPIPVTTRLLSGANLDWAYSETFQTEDRGAFENYFPAATARSYAHGPLIHFAETHDNNRLAARGKAYAKMRTALAALLSDRGAFGMTNGVEWFCKDKINVHAVTPLNENAAENQVAFIAKLNSILASHPAFAPGAKVTLIEKGGGNVLAALRNYPGGALLALVNLDAEHPQTVCWNAHDFSAETVRNLLTDSLHYPAQNGAIASFDLKPAEVFLLEARPSAAPIKKFRALATSARLSNYFGDRLLDGKIPPYFSWDYPRDLNRVVMIPSGFGLRIRTPHPFRALFLTDAGDPVQLVESENNEGYFLPPTFLRANEALSLELTLFPAANKVIHAPRASVLMLPEMQPYATPVAKGPGGVSAVHAILANRRGTAAQVRGAWGEIKSQYDAILAANLNPSAPDNRRVLFTRCRAWVRWRGYSHELGASCALEFKALPDNRSARWTFLTPIGMGRKAEIEILLTLAENANTATLRFSTTAAEKDITLILRPDLENRDFHERTQAFTAPEHTFPRAVAPRENGFSFAPLEMEILGGEFHHAPEWFYCVPHPIEAERGLAPEGDLFSPGWFSATLTKEREVVLVASTENVAQVPQPSATKESPLSLFLADRDNLQTVIAGFPWFLDWGRDTLIALRGLLADGQHRTASAILKEFASLEENGTLPNIIRGNDCGNRETSDAPLWFAVAASEAPNAETFRPTVVSIVKNIAKGCPNGVRMDEKTGLVFSPTHFTWMDTNYPACTPRAGYPVEIQALWIAALTFAGGEWLATAEKARASLLKYFILPENYLADCLSEDLVPDASLRPNQLLAITLGALSPTAPVCRGIIRACERLLVPGGIRSLDADDGKYKGRYLGDEDTSRKPAYHNGTAWAWQFPLFCEAAFKVYGDSAREPMRSLLGSVDRHYHEGCLRQIPEIMDGDAPHGSRGCSAQAWSISEVIRVAKLLQ